jgi:hypothetical protein
VQTASSAYQAEHELQHFHQRSHQRPQFHSTSFVAASGGIRSSTTLTENLLASPASEQIISRQQLQQYQLLQQQQQQQQQQQLQLQRQQFILSSLGQADDQTQITYSAPAAAAGGYEELSYDQIFEQEIPAPAPRSSTPGSGPSSSTLQQHLNRDQIPPPQ